MKEFNDFLGTLANWLEAIGFIVTVITAIKVFIIDNKVFEINRKHLFQVRIQEHINELKNISRKLANSLGNFDENKTKIRNEIKRSEEIAKSIQKKLEKKNKSNTKILISEAKKIQRLPTDINNLSRPKRWYYEILKFNEFNEEVISDFYVELTGCITSLEELKKDKDKKL